MKIGTLHYSMPPVIGGVERIIAAHSRLFRENGHEVALFCDGSQAEMTEEFRWKRVPGFCGGEASADHSDEMKSFLRAQNLQVLLVHNVLTMPFSLSATVALHQLAAERFPLVSWIHDLAASNSHYQIGKIGPEDLLRAHPPGTPIVAVSEERAIAYRKLTGCTSARVIPNGIDCLRELADPFFSKHPSLLTKLRGAFPILFLPARILRRKNIGLGIHVIAQLKVQGQNPRLIISGAMERFSGDEASYREELDQLSASLATEAEVFFLSDFAPPTGPEISDFYALADALFFPSEQEGFGLPILEASARRLPIFAACHLPLSALADRHGLSFSLETPPAQLARQIHQFFETDTGFHIRQTVRRDFDWQGIYCRDILPLLQTFL